MDITLTVILVCFVVFFIAGFIDAIAGGGGLITMPVLLLLGVPAHYTLGTGKLASSLGSITALITFWKRGAVIKEVVLLGVITSYFGAVIASATTLLISNEKMTIIMIFLLPVAILLSLFCGTLKLTEEDLPKKGLWWRVSVIGLSVGFYEGFFGPGAGSFFLIGIHLLLKAGLVKASGTAKSFNIAANLGAASAGTLYYSLALPCAVASILGNRLGAIYAVKIGPTLVRSMLYFVLVMLLLSLITRFVI